MGKVIMSGIVPQLVVPKRKLRASDLEVGSIVNLLENGSPVQYRVVHKGNPDSAIYDASCDGVWFWRVPYFSSVMWGTNASRYNNSDLHSYCSGTALNRFNSSEQALIKTVKIPYAASNSAIAELETKIFALSAVEVGAQYEADHYIYGYLPSDGAKLDYFDATNSADSKRVANGESVVHWTRSKFTSKNTAYDIGGDGGISSVGSTNTYNLCTALILDHSTLFDPETSTIII